jgi:hypothetical protein
MIIMIMILIIIMMVTMNFIATMMKEGLVFCA